MRNTQEILASKLEIFTEEERIAIVNKELKTELFKCTDEIMEACKYITDMVFNENGSMKKFEEATIDLRVLVEDLQRVGGKYYE